MPTISVITPVYNSAENLPACLDSLLGQLHRDIEIILVDDGSADACAALCDAYAEKDTRIHVIHQAHAGVAAARNTGLAAAKGQCISFVDSDDIVAPDFLETLVAHLEASGADIALCSYDWIDETGQPVGHSEPVLEGVLDSDNALTKLFFFDISKPATAFTSLCNKLYRAEVFGCVRFPDGRVYEDYAVMYRLFSTARVAVVGAVLYHRRRHPGAVLSQGAPGLFYDKLAADSELVRFAMQDEYVYLLPHALQTFWATFVRNAQAYLSPLPEDRPRARETRKLLRQYLPMVSRHTTLPAAERRRMWTFAYMPWLAKAD
ncbi:MAG: glycosyltransferase family 2 protein [Oscillospiraceae bacterium]